MKPNALAAHLRAATHSRRITPKMDHRVKRPVAQDLNIARGPMIPGLGAINIRGAKPMNAPLGQRLRSPHPTRLSRPGSRNLGIPIDHRLAAPHATQLPLAPGAFFPGMGDDVDSMFLGDNEFMPGMGDLGAHQLAKHAAASAHRKPVLRSVQKPRIKGAPATSAPTSAYGSFMPGLGEEEDSDVVAFGTLSAAELADGEIPANTAALAAPAAASALTKLMIGVAIFAAAGMYLNGR